jgi:hypothetical protein
MQLLKLVNYASKQAQELGRRSRRDHAPELFRVERRVARELDRCDHLPVRRDSHASGKHDAAKRGQPPCKEVRRQGWASSPGRAEQQRAGPQCLEKKRLQDQCDPDGDAEKKNGQLALSGRALASGSKRCRTELA